MGWRTTMALATAFLIACVIAWIDLRAEGRRADGSWFASADVPAPSDNVTRLLTFDPATLTAIRLQREDVDVRLERVNGRWEGVARPQAIDDFAHSLSELAEIIPLDVEPAQLHEYGLDPPAGVVTLERTGEPPVVLALGAHNPSSTGAYARVGPTGRVALTGAIALWELDKAIRVVREGALPAASAAVETPPA